MLGYEDFATYFLNETMSEEADEGSKLPDEYIPQFPAPDPWCRNNSCPDDFILLAEFSELEGPVPLVGILIYLNLLQVSYSCYFKLAVFFIIYLFIVSSYHMNFNLYKINNLLF